MKTSLKSLIIFLSFLSLWACKPKSDYERAREDLRKYIAIMNEAEQSSLTELKTPDGFRFDMTESEFDKELTLRESSLADSLTENNYKSGSAPYVWMMGKEQYAVGWIHKVFKEGKLCSYDITIKGRIVSSEFVSLTRSDINNICDFYKAFLEKDYTFDSLIHPSIGQTYVLKKNNMAITIVDKVDSYEEALEVTCENRPVTGPIERERQEAYRSKQSELFSSTPISSVEVKNNKWNGGVKQVENYLERTLRDPDSYESIEWSEVKEKSDGYYVRHKYRAKNGFGGYVVTNQLFHLDFNGNVVDVKDLY